MEVTGDADEGSCRSSRRVAVRPLFRRRVLNESVTTEADRFLDCEGDKRGLEGQERGVECVRRKRDLSMFNTDGEKLVERDFR